jgi:hypothetical protein
MKSSIHSLKNFIVVILFFQIIGQQTSQAQEQDTIAIIPPFLDKYQRDDWSGALELDRQEVVVFLYQNAAAVYMEADFNNLGVDSVSAEIGLPSTGYTIQDYENKEWNSKGLLGVKIWVDGEGMAPDLEEYSGDIWYSITPLFRVNQKTNIKTLFWVPTTYGDLDESGLSDSLRIKPGKRSLMICFSKAAMWKEDVNLSNFTVILKDGLNSSDETMEVFPKYYTETDSSFFWSMENIEPTSENDIIIRYNTKRLTKTSLNTLIKVHDYILEKSYNELIDYPETE